MNRRTHARGPLLAAAVLLAACGAGPEPAAAPGPATAASAPAAPVPEPTTDGSADGAPDAAAGAPSDPTTMPAVDYPDGIDPHRIVIPRLGVDAQVVDLSITADEVEVPEDFDQAGWWTSTRRPGEIGPAVIGGHVDSRDGPAVFVGLSRLEPGDEVSVVDQDGAEVVFVVDEVLRVDKYDRPPEVFGFGEARPELRLITCGGDLDPITGHYEDNDVVFLHQADWSA